MSDLPFAGLARIADEPGDDQAQLDALYRFAIERIGGTRAVLVEGTGAQTRLVTPGPAQAWREKRLPEREACAVEARLGDAAHAVIDNLGTLAPHLGRWLDVDVAWIGRLALDEAPGLLVIGLRAAIETPAAASALDVLRGFAIGLDWLRLRRATLFHRRLRDVVLAFGRDIPATSMLATGFETLCHELTAIVGARRTSIWLHDRRAQELVLEGSSDPQAFVAGGRVRTDERQSAAARGLRLDRPELVTGADVDRSGNDLMLLVPLRGRRRALGTLIFDGVPAPGAARAALVEAARDLGRHLSNAIENAQLLAEVLRSRRELENTFNSLADLVAVCDPGHRLVTVNQAFADRVGIEPARLIDQPLSAHVGAELAALVLKHDEERAAEPDAAPPARTHQLRDPVLRGTFSVTVTTLVDSESQQLGSVVVARDMTTQAQLEAERAALRQQLVQSEKLAALGQFVAGIAHELNNPLQGVLGHLELLRVTSKLTPTQRRDLRSISRDAERAARIVRNLLLFAGSGRPERRRYSPNSALARAVALRRRALRKAQIEVITRLDDRVPRLVGSPLMVQQALLNVIMNAEQAMAPGPGRLEVSSRVAKRRVIILIHDSGPGLSDEVQRRLFEPFFTTKDVGSGTGLGLALTYGIIQDHGGRIHAGNHRRGGAVFTIELPTDKMVIK